MRNIFTLLSAGSFSFLGQMMKVIFKAHLHRTPNRVLPRRSSEEGTIGRGRREEEEEEEERRPMGEEKKGKN